MRLPTLKKLSKRDARAVRVGAMLLLPVVGYLGVLAPAIRAITRDRATLAQNQRALESDRALLIHARTIAQDQARTTVWLAHEARRLLTGGTDIAATSGLSEYISTAAVTAGLQLQQSETRPSTPVSGTLRAIHVAVRGQGTARAVLAFLQSLENGGRLIRIDQLLIGPGSDAGIPLRVPVNTEGGPQLANGPPPAPDAKTRSLSITADIYGYALLPPPAGIRVLTAELGVAYEPLHGPGISPVSLADAITHNPFSRDRNATERAPVGVSITSRRGARGAPLFPVQLLGTVVGDAGDRGATFAMCSIAGGTPKVVRTGDQVAGYTVRGIERGRMSLVGADGRLVQLTLPTPGA